MVTVKENIPHLAFTRNVFQCPDAIATARKTDVCPVEVVAGPACNYSKNQRHYAWEERKSLLRKGLRIAVALPAFSVRKRSQLLVSKWFLGDAVAQREWKRQHDRKDPLHLCSTWQEVRRLTLFYPKRYQSALACLLGSLLLWLPSQQGSRRSLYSKGPVGRGRTWERKIRKKPLLRVWKPRNELVDNLQIEGINTIPAEDDERSPNRRREQRRHEIEQCTRLRFVEQESENYTTVKRSIERNVGYTVRSRYVLSVRTTSGYRTNSRNFTVRAINTEQTVIQHHEHQFQNCTVLTVRRNDLYSR